MQLRHLFPDRRRFQTDDVEAPPKDQKIRGSESFPSLGAKLIHIEMAAFYVTFINAPGGGNFDGLKTDKPRTPGHLPGLAGASLAESVKGVCQGGQIPLDGNRATAYTHS